MCFYEHIFIEYIPIHNKCIWWYKVMVVAVMNESGKQRPALLEPRWVTKKFLAMQLCPLSSIERNVK